MSGYDPGAGVRGRTFGSRRGFTFVELMVASVIFVFVVFAVGALYLSAKRSLDFGSAEVYLQRQGTLIQEELARHILRAASAQVAQCGPSGVTVPAGQSLLYQRLVASAATGALESEFWCIYQPPPGGPPPSLWRCRVSGLAPPQTCSGTSENLVANVIQPLPGQAVQVSNTSFAVAAVTCGGSPCATAASIDIRFELDLLQGASGASLLWGPRRFGFNTTIRN